MFFAKNRGKINFQKQYMRDTIIDVVIRLDGYSPAHILQAAEAVLRGGRRSGSET
jgi:hypothetical protein